MKYQMASIKQQALTLTIAEVHSLLERGVNYLLTGIIKNLVSHGKERFEINRNEYWASRVKHSTFLGVLLLVAPANHSGSSRAIMYSVYWEECSVHRGIPWVHWGISWVHREIFSTPESYHHAGGGYYDSCGRISWVHWGMFSTLRFSIEVKGFKPFPLPHESWCPPMCSRYPSESICSATWIMMSSDVLKVSLWCTQCTHDIPHMNHDIPPMYWTPLNVLNILRWGNRMRYEMAGIQQQAFTLRIAGVYSLLDRSVNYLLTGIIKNLVLHGKEKLWDKPQWALSQ